jgi:hypothetical protein
MFGVFSNYELQVIHDWLRGPASADGQAFGQAGTGTVAPRPSARAAARLAALRGAAQPAGADADPLDPDMQALQEQLRTLAAPARMELLVQAMSPAQHWTPAGLLATRLFRELAA